MPGPVVLHTVGHSNRPTAGLLNMLGAAGIATLVDIRAYPRSKRNPQYDETALQNSVEAAGMVYQWAGRQLGGLRRSEDPSRHTALTEPGARAFATYMETTGFGQSAARLVTMATQGPVAILCAEKDPHDCHRCLIADYLTLQGVRVIHLIDPATSREHQLSPQARQDSHTLIYDRFTTAALPGV